MSTLSFSFSWIFGRVNIIHKPEKARDCSPCHLWHVLALTLTLLLHSTRVLFIYLLFRSIFDAITTIHTPLYNGFQIFSKTSNFLELLNDLQMLNFYQHTGPCTFKQIDNSYACLRIMYQVSHHGYHTFSCPVLVTMVLTT